MAAESDVAPGTIKWRLHSGREKLRALLRPWLGTQSTPPPGPGAIAIPISDSAQERYYE